MNVNQLVQVVVNQVLVAVALIHDLVVQFEVARCANSKPNETTWTEPLMKCALNKLTFSLGHRDIFPASPGSRNPARQWRPPAAQQLQSALLLHPKV